MDKRWMIVVAAAVATASCSQDDGASRTARTAPAATMAPEPAPVQPSVEEIVAAAAAERAALAQIFDDEFEASLRLNPISATFTGDPRFNHIWPNSLGETYLQASEAHEREFLGRIQEIDPQLLEGQDLLSYQLFLRDREDAIEAFSFPSHLTPINQFFSTPNFFAQMGSGQSAQPFATVEDYDAWLGRVSGFDVWVDQAITNMRQGLQVGITRPRAIMEKVVPQLAAHVVDDVEDSIFYRPVANMPEGFSDEDRARIDAEYRAVIEGVIIPTYRALHDFISDEYVPGATEHVGLSGIPGGAEWYAYLVRQYTTTDMTPDQIHDIGLSEVSRIHGEMREVMAQVGFEGELHDFFDFMQTDPQFYFESEEELLTSYRSLRELADEGADRLFSLQPEADYEIRPVEAFRAASSSAASYSRAAPDGSRPGIFYVNTYDLSARPRYAMEALFLHEAVPGHHFQIAIQQELGDLPAFRRFGGYTAFTEGWGLYAESLGREMGFYTDPYMYYGKLQAELWRAIRLVLDTGMHAKGWTREQALEFAYANSDVAETRAVSEVERFIAIPGQALAYKIGQLKIQELRDRAEAALGEAFDVRGFHAVVIGVGAVPLSVLEQRVDAWIESQI